MKLRIFIKQDEYGMFVSEVPELPGCISQGNTRETAITNIKDAISGYITSLKKHDELIPLWISKAGKHEITKDDNDNWIQKASNMKDELLGHNKK